MEERKCSGTEPLGSMFRSQEDENNNKGNLAFASEVEGNPEKRELEAGQVAFLRSVSVKGSRAMEQQLEGDMESKERYFFLKVENIAIYYLIGMIQQRGKGGYKSQTG